MSHKSEEQWQYIGTCPNCESPLYLMGSKIKWHECIPDDLEDYVTKQVTPFNLQGMVKDILNVT